MSLYETDDAAEPARIVTMRLLRKLQKQGELTGDDTGQPRLNDLFENVARER